MLATRRADTDRAVAASQPRASGGGQGSVGLSREEEEGVGGQGREGRWWWWLGQFRGQRGTVARMRSAE